MCAGAILNARISRLVYGADDPKAGAVRSLFHILNSSALNHRVSVRSGLLEKECRLLMQSFFTKRR
jgi:tRNA(adenine34) deaminase